MINLPCILNNLLKYEITVIILRHSINFLTEIQKDKSNKN